VVFLSGEADAFIHLSSLLLGKAVLAAKGSALLSSAES